MKTIGMIGGLSWHSTVEYYRSINLAIQKQLGGRNAAKIVMHSVNFAEIEKLQIDGRWDLLAKAMVGSAKSLEKAGADFVMICANTMHKVAHEVESAISIPLLHIVDATAEAIQQRGLTKVGLLATRFTMSEPFYTDRLSNNFGITALVPDENERAEIHRVIHQEIMSNILSPGSKAAFIKIIDRLVSNGAQGIILGCTEIPLLIKSADTSIPLFDTALIHSEKAVEWALSDAFSILPTKAKGYTS